MSSLTLQILDGGQPTNKFEFYPSEDLVLTAQIYDANTNQHFPIPELGRSLSLIMPGNRTNIEIADADITVNAQDASVFTANIADDVSVNMSSGNFRLEITYKTKGDAPDLSTFLLADDALLTIGTTEYDFSADGNADGSFTCADVSGLELGQIGTITSSTNTTGIEVIVESVTIGSPSTIVVKEAITITRNAQLQNAIKRLNPVPTI